MRKNRITALIAATSIALTASVAASTPAAAAPMSAKAIKGVPAASAYLLSDPYRKTYEIGAIAKTKKTTSIRIEKQVVLSGRKVWKAAKTCVDKCVIPMPKKGTVAYQVRLYEGRTPGPASTPLIGRGYEDINPGDKRTQGVLLQMRFKKGSEWAMAKIASTYTARNLGKCVKDKAVKTAISAATGLAKKYAKGAPAIPVRMATTLVDDIVSVYDTNCKAIAGVIDDMTWAAKRTFQGYSPLVTFETKYVLRSSFRGNPTGYWCQVHTGSDMTRLAISTDLMKRTECLTKARRIMS